MASILLNPMPTERTCSEGWGCWMKRFFVIAAGVVLLCFALTFAAEKPPVPPPTPPRVPAMSAAGKVLELSDTIMKIERTLKGKVETMEFLLESPFMGVVVGDQIKVSYLEKGGRNVLIRVTPAKKTAIQKSRKEPPKIVKQTESEPKTATK
jgi:hypothetical protein